MVVREASMLKVGFTHNSVDELLTLARLGGVGIPKKMVPPIPVILTLPPFD